MLADSQRCDSRSVRLTSVDDVSRLLAELNDAWKEIGDKGSVGVDETPEPNPMQVAMSYGKA